MSFRGREVRFSDHQIDPCFEDYVSRLPLPVHVLRTGVRSGLIRARLLGAKAAKAGADSSCYSRGSPGGGGGSVH